jgi:hypothetical protein
MVTVNEKEKKIELPKVKVRLRSLVGTARLPIELTILPRVKAIFDENAITEVTMAQSRILLGPARTGEGWELVKEEEIPKPKVQAPTGAKTAKTTAPPPPEANQEFLDKVRG